MRLKKTIRKALVLGAWLLVSGGIASLLVAANSKKQAHHCRQVTVTVRGEGEKLYIDKNDVLGQLKAAVPGGIVDRPITEINLAGLERMLERGQWIRDAELYFDSRDVLHVVVAAREPVARVFTTAGTSFYIDSAGQRMPLLSRVSIRVPVVTGFTPAKRLNRADSLLLRSVTGVARYINGDAFWNAQIAQIDILQSGTFELVPVIGNHVVRIGRADALEEKLGRLLLFYRQVAARTGFDRYAAIDVQYKDQVIGIKQMTTSAIDSVQLQQNILALQERSQLQAITDSMAAANRKAAPAVKSGAAVKERVTSGAQHPEGTKLSGPIERGKAQKAGGQQPKAVMRKRN